VRKSTQTGGTADRECTHRPPCPGCPRFGESGLGVHATETLSRLADDTGAHLHPVIEGDAWHFRTRARLAVRGRSSSPKVGIFRAGTHDIVDVPRCLVHHSRINEVAGALRAAIRSLGIPPYADRPHRGVVRYVQIAIERATARAQVVIVANATDPGPLDPLAERLAATLGDTLHGLWWNGNADRTNVILGPLWHHWMGERAITESLGGAHVLFHPGAFCQANGSVLDLLVRHVHAAVPDGANVVELYAGAGTFGLGLLARVSTLACNEVNPYGLWSLEAGASLRPRAERDRFTLLPGPADAHLAACETAEVVVADPPRRGLDPAVRDAIGRGRATRVVLVACDVNALDRDARALVESGFRLRELIPIAAFRFTERAETVAVFDRR